MTYTAGKSTSLVLLLVAAAYGASTTHATEDLCPILATKACKDWQYAIAKPATYLFNNLGYDGMGKPYSLGNKNVIVLVNSLKRCRDWYESTFECKDHHITETEVLCQGDCGKVPHTCAVPVKMGETIPYILGINHYGDAVIKHPDGTMVHTCTGSGKELEEIEKATAVAKFLKTVDLCPILASKACKGWQRIAEPSKYMGQYGYDKASAPYFKGNTAAYVLTNNHKKCQDQYQSTFTCKKRKISESVLCRGKCGKKADTCAVMVEPGTALSYALGINQHGDLVIQNAKHATAFTCNGSAKDILKLKG